MSGSDPIVLIHGFWVTPRSWEHWITHYEARGYRVLAPAVIREIIYRLLTGAQAEDEPREQPFVAGIYHKPPDWAELVELMSSLVKRFLPPREVVVVPGRTRTEQ